MWTAFVASLFCVCFCFHFFPICLLLELFFNLLFNSQWTQYCGAFYGSILPCKVCSHMLWLGTMLASPVPCPSSCHTLALSIPWNFHYPEEVPSSWPAPAPALAALGAPSRAQQVVLMKGVNALVNRVRDWSALLLTEEWIIFQCLH